MKKVEKISEAIEFLAEKYGNEIFEHPNRVNALLGDIAPELKKERRRIKLLFESNSADLLLKACDNPELSEVYISEAVTRLMSYSDMNENAAEETVDALASALNIQNHAAPKPKSTTQTQTTPQQEAQAPKPQPQTAVDDDDVIGQLLSNKAFTKSIRPWYKKPLPIIGILLGSAAIIAGIILLIIYTTGTTWKYIIGIGSGLVLTALSILIAWLVEENIFNEKYQTYTFITPIVTVANVVLSILLGADYTIIFHCIGAFTIIGSCISAFMAFYDFEKGWGFSNLIVPIINIVMLLLWPFDFEWSVWQWIIGIGGSLVGTLLLILIGIICDAFGTEYYRSMSAAVLILSFVNILLLYLFTSEYFVIAACFAAVFSIISIILAFMSFNDIEVGLGIFNLILALINAGVFLLIALGYEGELMAKIKSMLPAKGTAIQGKDGTI